MNTTKIKSIVFYVIVAIIVITYFIIRLPAFKNSFSIGTTSPVDFPQDYIAGKQLLAGKSMYPSNYMDIYIHTLSMNNVNIPQRLKYVNGINAHPPFTAIFLLPLCLLSFHNAIYLYSFITLICMFLITLLLMKSEDISWFYLPLMILFVLAWPPFQANLAVGQIAIFVALFTLAGWYSLIKGKENMSGIFIALATMLKFYPGLFLVYFLINKRYRAFIISVISISLILVLTLVVTRYNFYYYIFHIMPTDAKYWGADIGNLSINGYIAKLFLSVKAYYNVGVFAASENYLYKNIFFSITVAVIILYSIVSIKRYDYNHALGFSVFIILSLLLSPICWNHYLTLLLLPLIVFAKELRKKRTISEIVIFLTALLFISIDTKSVYFLKVLYIVHGVIPGNPESFFYRMTFYSLPFYGMVLLLFLNFRMIKNYSKVVTESH